MARLFTSGFELNSILAGTEMSGTSNSPGLSTTTVRSGTYALRIFGMSSGSPKGMGPIFASAAGDGPYFFRAYFRFATLPSAENAIVLLNDATNFTTPVAYITIDNGGALRLYDEDGVIGSPSSALSTGTWYRIEMKLDRTPASGSEEIAARIDGVDFASSTSRSLSTGVNVFWVGGNLLSEAQTTGEWFIDDIAVNDSNGSFENSYPGDGSVVYLRPNGAGDNTQWTRGGSDSGANYSQCDETTPNDATDYVESNTADQIDDYDLEATPGAIGSGDTIKVVVANVRWRVADATGTDPSFVVRVKASSGGTVEESSAYTSNNANWRTNAQANNVPPLTLYDLPGASTTAWTKADLDTAQIGVRESVSDTHTIQVSNLFLIVEYAAAAPGGGAVGPLLGGHLVKRGILQGRLVR